MSSQIRFSNDFTSVTVNGTKKKLTPNERLLCRYMASKPNQLLSRDRLLEALKQSDQFLLDRNIDGVVSRLRKKLEDSAQHPEIIETIYGEGYRWLAVPASESKLTQPTFDQLICLTPPTELVDDNFENLAAFLKSLQEGLNKNFAKHRSYAAVCEESYPGASKPNSRFTLRSVPISTTIKITKISLVFLDNKTHQQHAILKDAINSKDLTQRLVDKLTNKILDLILMCELEAPTSLPLLDSEPLSTRLFKVSKDFGRFETTHEWARKRIRQKLRDNPNDSKLRILMAVILNNRQIMGHVQRLEEVENQILELVQSSVDDVSGDALYLSACAGLLYRFGNKQTAKQKLENSLALGTHIAACYLEAGRINAFEGNFEAAHWYYDHAIIDAHEGSDFHQMLLTLKAIAYLAEGNSAEVSKALAKMLSHEENFFKRVMMEFLFNSRSRDMRLVHRALYKSLPGALFKRVLLTAYNNSARWFEKPEHQYNLMARMTDTTIRLKGRSCIPAEVLAITDMDSQVSERQSANST